MKVLCPGRIGIWRYWFLWGEENRSTRKKPLEQGKNQQQTQPTSGRNRSPDTLVEGERSHYCPKIETLLRRKSQNLNRPSWKHSRAIWRITKHNTTMCSSYLLLCCECHRIPSNNLSVGTGAPYRGVPVRQTQIKFVEFIAVKITGVIYD